MLLGTRQTMTKATNPIPVLVEELRRVEGLRRPATWLLQVGAGPPRRLSHRLEQWLGHPAHPLFTDLPIGFWTSSLVLDLAGGRRSAKASRRLVGLGVVTAVPTALVGLGDAVTLSNDRRRVAVVHATFNVVATLVYAWSWASRRRDRRLVGALLGLAGAGVATVGGLLGGHLVYGPKGVDSAAEGDVVDPTTGVVAGDLSEQLIDVELDKRRVPQPHRPAHVRGL